MLRTLKMTFGLIIVLVIAFGSAKSTSAEDPIPVVPKIPQTVSEMIDQIAPTFDQDSSLIKKITWCESEWQVVDHDNHAGLNVTGIHDTTFDGWLPLYEAKYHETLDKNSTYDQIKMMAFAFSLGSSYRNQWTTYVAYMNGGTYSFYSMSLKAHFVVHCK